MNRPSSEFGRGQVCIFMAEAEFTAELKFLENLWVYRFMYYYCNTSLFPSMVELYYLYVRVSILGKMVILG